jgi:DNA mismatch repair protein MutS
VLLGAIRSFAQQMRTVRDHLRKVDKVHYLYPRQRWFLDTVEVYCASISRLSDDLDHADLQSPGFMSLREYLTAYTGSSGFLSIVAETHTSPASVARCRAGRRSSSSSTSCSPTSNGRKTSRT